MSVYKLLAKAWSKPETAEETRVRRYSTTGDILSYKRCRRQYGMFGVRGFVSATNTQRYFGTLVHDVLDQATRKWKESRALVNDEADVADLVEQAHERLIRAGIRPYAASRQKEAAIRLTYRFLKLVGPALIPNVQEAEYRLERSLKTNSGWDYILEGIVDVLAGPVSHELGVGTFSTEPDDVEIWDYKSAKCPAKNSLIMRDYEYQMRVYAELYKNQRGEYPARCILAFLGELDKKASWSEEDLDPARYPKLIYVVGTNPKHIARAMDDFHDTVDAIERERELQYSAQWKAPEHDVERDTCVACELRFRCDRFPDGGPMRGEPL